MLINWTCKKVQLMLLVCRFSNWFISKPVGVNSFSFDKIISIEMFLVKFGWGVEKICFFDHFLSAKLTEKVKMRLSFLLIIFVQKYSEKRTFTLLVAVFLVFLTLRMNRKLFDFRIIDVFLVTFFGVAMYLTSSGFESLYQQCFLHIFRCPLTYSFFNCKS